MNNLQTTAAPTPEQQRYAEAIDSAVDILFYYDEDEYQSLERDSVIDDLSSNFHYSLREAEAMLETASVIYEYRKLSGFYN